MNKEWVLILLMGIIIVLLIGLVLFQPLFVCSEPSYFALKEVV